MELVARIITSIILLACIISILLFLPSQMMALVIVLVYSYAFFVEYIPLVYKSFPKAPVISVMMGIAIVTTGIFHALWIYTPYTDLYVLICIGAAVLSDMGGYIVGNLCGRYLLVPTISPKKTWEGLAGSIVITSFLFVLCIYAHYLIALLGALLAGAGLCGDLLFSYIKRAAGVKDTGSILPGHGGILDRLDSIIGTTMALLLILLLLKACNQVNLFDQFALPMYHIF